MNSLRGKWCPCQKEMILWQTRNSHFVVLKVRHKKSCRTPRVQHPECKLDSLQNRFRDNSHTSINAWTAVDRAKRLVNGCTFNTNKAPNANDWCNLWYWTRREILGAWISLTWFLCYTIWQRTSFCEHLYNSKRWFLLYIIWKKAFFCEHLDNCERFASYITWQRASFWEHVDNSERIGRCHDVQI